LGAYTSQLLAVNWSDGRLLGDDVRHRDNITITG